MTFDRAKAALSGSRFADLRHVAATGSTNADLVTAARGGTGECVLVADHQSAGRGRLDRRWEAPPGASLLMSVLVRGPVAATVPHLVGTALGVCAADAVEELAGVAVGLKWPNDLVVAGAGEGGGDAKLGGLLAELVAGPEPAVVAGLGCNLDWPDGFPPALAGSSTALNLLGASVNREDLVVALLTELGPTLERLAEDGGAGLLARYRERCVTLGRRVRVVLPAGEVVGLAVDVAASGALVVDDDADGRREVTVGDVVHLRPA